MNQFIDGAEVFAFTMVFDEVHRVMEYKRVLVQ
jgi:hypothetical protein